MVDGDDGDDGVCWGPDSSMSSDTDGLPEEDVRTPSPHPPSVMTEHIRALMNRVLGDRNMAQKVSIFAKQIEENRLLRLESRASAGGWGSRPVVFPRSWS